ncbi:hypothetical protein [Cardinium endosymbiont of Philonthus spinipes]|uniref:hypothetical protein n=1 Tax=Cardinium endosymbiont of Philonthus spinipes TaxID=3077941 RepID=UPI00313B32CE
MEHKKVLLLWLLILCSCNTGVKQDIAPGPPSFCLKVHTMLNDPSRGCNADSMSATDSHAYLRRAADLISLSTDKFISNFCSAIDAAPSVVADDLTTAFHSAAGVRTAADDQAKTARDATSAAQQEADTIAAAQKVAASHANADARADIARADTTVARAFGDNIVAPALYVRAASKCAVAAAAVARAVSAYTAVAAAYAAAARAAYVAYTAGYVTAFAQVARAAANARAAAATAHDFAADAAHFVAATHHYLASAENAAAAAACAATCTASMRSVASVAVARAAATDSVSIAATVAAGIRHAADAARDASNAAETAAADARAASASASVAAAYASSVRAANASLAAFEGACRVARAARVCIRCCFNILSASSAPANNARRLASLRNYTESANAASAAVDDGYAAVVSAHAVACHEASLARREVAAGCVDPDVVAAVAAATHFVSAAYIAVDFCAHIQRLQRGAAAHFPVR